MLALLVLAAAPQTGVVVVQMSSCCRGEAWPEAEGALRDELRSAGLAVELVIGTATGERERRIELGVLAEEKNAACAVRISRPSGASSIEMWVSDRVTGKVLFREISLGSPGRLAGPHLVALRAIEAIRASLLELQLEPPAKPELREALSSVEPPLAPVATEAPGPWRLAITAGVQGGPGGTGTSAQLGVAARWEHFEHLPLSLDATLSVFGGGVKSQGLRSTFETVHVRLLAGWEPWAGRVRPSLVALAGVAVPFAEGLGMQGVTVRRDQGLTAR